MIPLALRNRSDSGFSSCHGGDFAGKNQCGPSANLYDGTDGTRRMHHAWRPYGTARLARPAGAKRGVSLDEVH